RRAEAVCSSSRTCAQPDQGVDRLGQAAGPGGCPHLELDVGPLGCAVAADGADDLAVGDRLAFPDVNVAEIEVERVVAAAVTDHDTGAVALEGASHDHGAGFDGADGRAGLCADADPVPAEGDAVGSPF